MKIYLVIQSFKVTNMANEFKKVPIEYNAPEGTQSS